MPLTWASGEIVTAAKMNARNPLRIAKVADEGLSSNTTLQNDDELVLALVAGRTYRIEANLVATGNVAGDIKVAWATSGTITLVGQRVCQGPALTMTTPTDTTMRTARASALNTAVSYGCAATAAHIKETFEVSCTVAGNLTLQWAQDTSNAGATTMIGGSWLTATPVD